ncbi:MAG: T9SS type A sorting domain-containing protein [Candidatus Kapabacteria bacterium]|nr:T9SS type A sorting domain-containing protein [Candidatus Kapabacteria bacterium]
MKSVILILFFIFSITGLYSQNDWRIIPTGQIDSANNCELRDVLLLSDSIIIVAVYNEMFGTRVYRSSDSGTQWSLVLQQNDSLHSSSNFKLHHFIQNNNCFACFAGYSPLCLRSTDKGLSWDTSQFDKSLGSNMFKRDYYEPGMDIDFFSDGKKGIMSCQHRPGIGGYGTYAIILETSDSGKSWNQRCVNSHLSSVFEISILKDTIGIIHYTSGLEPEPTVNGILSLDGICKLPKRRDDFYKLLEYNGPILVMHKPNRFLCFKREKGYIYSFIDFKDILDDSYNDSLSFFDLKLRYTDGSLPYTFVAACEPNLQTIYIATSQIGPAPKLFNHLSDVFHKSNDGGKSFYKIRVPDPLLNRHLEGMYDRIQVYGENTVAAISKEQLIISYNGGGNPISTVEDINNSATTFLYPNPAQSTITVTQPGIVYIVDVLGNTVLQEYNVQTTNSISIAHLPLGMYTVCLQGNTLYQVQKLLIVR